VRLALCGLFDFLDRFDQLIDSEGNRVPNPLRRLDIPRPQQPKCLMLTPQQRDLLIVAARTPHEQIVIPLLAFGGFRAGEAVRLDNPDVDLENGSLRVLVSKTARGRRSIPLRPELLEPIIRWSAYCERKGLHTANGPFLVTRSGGRMQERYVWKIVRTVSARAGITCTDGSPVSPHTLRRTFGTELLNRGARLEVVSRVLGHAATTITESAYAHLQDETIRREIRSCTPLRLLTQGLKTNTRGCHKVGPNSDVLAHLWHIARNGPLAGTLSPPRYIGT
jgi:integrase